jgi:hypothetical protein
MQQAEWSSVQCVSAFHLHFLTAANPQEGIRRHHQLIISSTQTHHHVSKRDYEGSSAEQPHTTQHQCHINVDLATVVG